MAHILLHRGMLTIESLLPGFRAELLRRGAVPFDTGQMPWLGEHGWLDTTVPGWEVVSATRPLMDDVARELLGRAPGVAVHGGVRVTGLHALARCRWRVDVAADPADAPDRGVSDRSDGDVQVLPDDDLSAAVVVDATGRGSRLGHWLPAAGADVEEVDARVGYAARLYEARSPVPLHTGVMIFGTLPDGAAGLALPVERGRWIIAGSGMGDARPPRDAAGFEAFLGELRDPAIADLVSRLEPIGDVAVHRQTANRRHAWGRRSDWPSGLLAIGDALCSLNPIYGQGITVAALQAELLRDTLAAGRPVDRRLQRRMLDAAELPWSIATGSDLRYPSCASSPSALQRLTGAYTDRLTRLAATGDPRPTTTFSALYHLMSPPSALFRPALLAAAARRLPERRLPRPAVLAGLSPSVRRPPPPAPRPADPAGA
jgi:hypothetical protein